MCLALLSNVYFFVATFFHDQYRLPDLWHETSTSFCFLVSCHSQLTCFTPHSTHSCGVPSVLFVVADCSARSTWQSPFSCFVFYKYKTTIVRTRFDLVYNSFWSLVTRTRFDFVYSTVKDLVYNLFLIFFVHAGLLTTVSLRSLWKMQPSIR